MTVGTLVLLMAAAVLAEPRASALAGEPPAASVTTEVILEVGKPQQADAPAMPAGTVLLFESRSGSAMDRYVQLRQQLRDAYRLDSLTKHESAMLQLAVGESKPAPSPIPGLEIAFKLLAVDELHATYEVRLAEAGAEPVVTRVAAKRTDWAILGGRDGAAAPYFYVLFRPLTAAEEKAEARWEGITKPKVLTSVQPTYPEEARKAREQDIVVLELDIRADGTVAAAAALEGKVPSLIEAARAAALQWTFTPARDAAGRPIPVKYSITLAFKLH